MTATVTPLPHPTIAEQRRRIETLLGHIRSLDSSRQRAETEAQELREQYQLAVQAVASANARAWVFAKLAGSVALVRAPWLVLGGMVGGFATVVALRLAGW